jgi:hypothetical protein
MTERKHPPRSRATATVSNNVVQMTSTRAPQRGRTTKDSTTKPADIIRQERIAAALQLRRAGHSYTRIAETIMRSKEKYGVKGYTRASAYRDVQDGMDGITVEPALDMLAAELDRLNAMTSAVWGKVMQGDTDAIRTVIRIQERRSRYLGLDSPTRQVIIGATSDELAGINLTAPNELMRAGTALLEDLSDERNRRKVIDQ